MPFAQSVDRALQSGIGEGGVPGRAFLDQLRRAEEALIGLREVYDKKKLPLLLLPEKTDDLPALTEAAQQLAEASDVVFLGTGGSSLGGQAIAQLADYAVPGLGVLRDKPRVHFLDNLDPLTFGKLLERLPLATTRFVAISKSGTTGETLMQTIAVTSALEAAGLKEKLPDHLLGLSEPGKRYGLRDLLESRGCEVLDHDPGVGGRYSALSNVGLLPALVLGLDAAAIRDGARDVLAKSLTRRPAKEIPAAAGAALSVAAAAEGKSIRVMMAYADRLERFTKWWVQLWAESLGKKGKGAAPIAALGPVDQHSQLQLWLDGPRDKLFTVITTGVAGAGPRMDKVLAEAAHEPGLAGKTIGDLVAAQGRATADTLAKNGRPVRTIHVEQLDERALGALMMHFMLETIIAAHLLGVDPYDQPAVEEGKILAKKYLAGEKWAAALIRVTDRIFIDEREIEEEFVRASGPGGQNVNKLSTAVRLRFNARNSPSLPPDVRSRLMGIAGKRLTNEGELVIFADRHRTQERNRADAQERLLELICRAAERPVPRRKTRPPISSKRKRLEGKKHRGQIKSLRRVKPGMD